MDHAVSAIQEEAQGKQGRIVFGSFALFPRSLIFKGFVCLISPLSISWSSDHDSNPSLKVLFGPQNFQSYQTKKETLHYNTY